MPDQHVYAGYDPRQPHVVIALDLTVNGEPYHFEQPFPLYAWEQHGAEGQAALALSVMQAAAADMIYKQADHITVSRDGRRIVPPPKENYG